MIKLFIAVMVLFANLAMAQPPADFRAAKATMKRVYAGQTSDSFYCGCSWNWSGRRGSGRMNLDSCGYSVRNNAKRAARLEWEHVVPASLGGRQMACWSEARSKSCGGKSCDSRSYCRSQSKNFASMEADMHNLVPAIGEVNGDRSNYQFGELAGERRAYGRCDIEIDSKRRIAEPKESRRGMIARIYLYMSDRYGIRLSSSQRSLFNTWNTRYPATGWEIERNQRITAIQGWGNPYIDGNPTRTAAASESTTVPVRGNLRSKIYHLPEGCPSYDAMSQRNRIEFASERDARNAGYRKARNCEH